MGSRAPGPVASALLAASALVLPLLALPLFVVPPLVAQSARPSTTEAAPPRVLLEKAPADLAGATAKDVLIAAGDDGRELFVFDPADARVERFLESGERWGDPIELVAGPSPLPTVIRMDVRDGHLLLSGNTGIVLFTTDGELVARHRLFQPGDTALVGGDRWVVSLVNVPHPARPGRFLGRGDVEGEAPRLALYEGAEASPGEEGLFEGGGASASKANAGALRLAWGERRLYAAEVGNYRVHVLDRELDPRAELGDPAHDFTEDELTAGDSPGADQVLEPPRGTARDLAAAPARKPPFHSLRVRVDAVVADIAWGRQPGALYLLLDAAGFGGDYVIDVLDPASGEVRRTLLDLPAAWNDTRLKQIAVGRQSAWLRGYAEGSPVFRVDRSVLDQGAELRLPNLRLEPDLQVEDLQVEEPSGDTGL